MLQILLREQCLNDLAFIFLLDNWTCTVVFFPFNYVCQQTLCLLFYLTLRLSYNHSSYLASDYLGLSFHLYSKVIYFPLCNLLQCLQPADREARQWLKALVSSGIGTMIYWLYFKLYFIASNTFFFLLNYLELWRDKQVSGGNGRKSQKCTQAFILFLLKSIWS